MKNIFKYLMTLAGVAAIFASCVQEAKPLASAVSVDKTELEFEGTEAPAECPLCHAKSDKFVELLTVTGLPWLRSGLLLSLQSVPEKLRLRFP